jgi:hypothetical protein
VWLAFLVVAGVALAIGYTLGKKRSLIASTPPADFRAIATGDGLAPLPDKLVILAIATEWDSRYGGLSTLNRELCVALAKLGHQVYCGVPRLLESEVRAARASGVVLVAPEPIPGTNDEQAPDRPLVGIPKNVDVVIGHARKTGGAALAQVHYCGGRPKYVHFVHMDPHAIEWSKKADDRDREATRSAQERVDEEVAIGSRSALGALLVQDLHECDNFWVSPPAHGRRFCQRFRCQ